MCQIKTMSLFPRLQKDYFFIHAVRKVL